MYDTTSLGELLIDFTPRGTSEHGSYVFEANSGGAPCNVLAAMSALSKKTAFIGKTGTDVFGVFLKNTLDKLNIDSTGLIMTSDYFTTLAFVTLDEDGNRSFSFSRNNSADVMLTPDEVNEDIIKNSKIFHCGTLSLTHPLSHAATLKALNTARDNGVIISTDPNLRLSLWKNETDAREAIRLVMKYADVIKISDYEIEFLYGTKDVKEGAKRLQAEYEPKILFATCGKDGAYVVKNDIIIHHPCFDNVETVDTTGAGDSFCGTALSCLIDYNLDFEGLDYDKCYQILRYASAAASLTTTKFGAIPAMPSKDDIEKIMK